MSPRRTSCCRSRRLLGSASPCPTLWTPLFLLLLLLLLRWQRRILTMRPGPDAILLPVCATAEGIPCIAVQARAIVRGARVSPVSTRAICAARGGWVVLGPTGAALDAAAVPAAVSCAPREEDACGAPWEVPLGCGVVRLAPRAPPTCCNCTARDALPPAAASSSEASARAWRRARRWRETGDESLAAAGCGSGLRLECVGDRMLEFSHDAAGLRGAVVGGWVVGDARTVSPPMGPRGTRRPALAVVMVLYGESGAAARAERAVFTFASLRRHAAAGGGAPLDFHAIVIVPALRGSRSGGGDGSSGSGGAWGPGGGAAAVLAHAGVQVREAEGFAVPVQCRAITEGPTNGTAYLSLAYLVPG